MTLSVFGVRQRKSIGERRSLTRVAVAAVVAVVLLSPMLTPPAVDARDPEAPTSSSSSSDLDWIVEERFDESGMLIESTWRVDPGTDPHPGVLQRAMNDGENDLAIILLDTSSDGLVPFDRAEAAARVYDGVVNEFFEEVSWGQKRFDGDITDVYGWLVADDVASIDQPCKAGIGYQWIRDLIAEAGIVLDDYEHLLFLLNCGPPGAGGASSLGIRDYSYQWPEAGCVCSNSYVAADVDRWNDVYNGIHFDVVNANGDVVLPYLEAVTIHELGHGVGGPHDSLRTCGDKIWDVDANCDDLIGGNYGNFYSALGRMRGWAWGFSAAQRHQLGWLGADRLDFITTTGTYDIGSISVADDGQAKAAAVVDPVSGEIAYFVELRSPTGFDADVDLAPLDNEVHISSLYHRNSSYPIAALLDGQPDSPGLDLANSDYTDDEGYHYADKVGFGPGVGFYDPNYGLGITVHGVDADTHTASFSVMMGDLPVLGDVDCDGAVTIADALFIAQHTVEVRNGVVSCPLPLPSQHLVLEAGDVDNSGDTSVTDALFIAQCQVGIDNGYCSG